MKKAVLLVVGLGLVLVMGLKANAILVIGNSDRIDVGGTSGIGDIVQQQNQRLLEAIVNSVNAKAISQGFQSGDLIKELEGILAQIGGFQVVGNKIIDSAGNVWTLEDRTTKDAQGNVVSQGTVLTKTVKAQSISDDATEFKGEPGGMTTISHVIAEYNEKGQRIKEIRDGTRFGTDEKGNEINEAFYTETTFQYSSIGLVIVTEAITSSDSTDWMEVIQVVYNTDFYKDGRVAERYLDIWGADGSYRQIRQYNIVWDGDNMVEWDEEVNQESQKT